MSFERYLHYYFEINHLTSKFDMPIFKNIRAMQLHLFYLKHPFIMVDYHVRNEQNKISSSITTIVTVVGNRSFVFHSLQVDPDNHPQYAFFKIPKANAISGLKSAVLVHYSCIVVAVHCHACITSCNASCWCLYRHLCDLPEHFEKNR